MEIGFPTSDLLKQQISEAVDVRYGECGDSVEKGDPKIADAIKKFSEPTSEKGIQEYNRYLYAGWHIARAMPQAISIDNFIEVQENTYTTQMAKLGIASTIIDAEQKCAKEFTISAGSNEVVWSRFQSNWIHFFCQTLTEGVKKSDLSNLFDNLRFIIFNYDRSLEFFLTKSLENYYGLNEKEAQEIVSNATFIHPYGQVGKLSWQTSDLPIQDFGANRKETLFEISRSILTFSEQIEDEDQLGEIQSSIESADQIIFLGFAFHEANMQILTGKRTRDTRQVFGTAYKISEPDLIIINNQVKRMCLTERMITSGVGQFVLDNKATCSSLFTTYGKSITS